MSLDDEIRKVKNAQNMSVMDYISSIELTEIDDETGEILQRFTYRPNEKTKLSIMPKESED